LRVSVCCEFKFSNATVAVLRVFFLSLLLPLKFLILQLYHVNVWWHSPKYIKLFFIIKVNTLSAVNGKGGASVEREQAGEIVVCDMAGEQARMMEISIHIYIKIPFNSFSDVRT
jgi:hypothetical protein